MELATLTAIGAALGGVGSILSATNAFGGGDDAPPMPGVTTPEAMPSPDDAASKAAKRKQLSALAQRRGRQSTILSDSTQSADLLGG